MQVFDSVKIWLERPHVKMGALIFLIALLSFGAGYLTGRDWTPAPIIIENNTSN